VVAVLLVFLILAQGGHQPSERQAALAERHLLVRM
jgi:hypothetical protein